jgi:hypothetical protein
MTAIDAVTALSTPAARRLVRSNVSAMKIPFVSRARMHRPIAGRAQRGRPPTEFSKSIAITDKTSP